jgi:hypothetical protein
VSSPGYFEFTHLVDQDDEHEPEFEVEVSCDIVSIGDGDLEARDVVAKRTDNFQELSEDAIVQLDLGYHAVEAMMSRTPCSGEDEAGFYYSPDLGTFWEVLDVAKVDSVCAWYVLARRLLEDPRTLAQRACTWCKKPGHIRYYDACPDGLTARARGIGDRAPWRLLEFFQSRRYIVGGDVRRFWRIELIGPPPEGQFRPCGVIYAGDPLPKADAEREDW